MSNQEFIKGAGKILLTLHCLLSFCYALKAFKDCIQKFCNVPCLAVLTVAAPPKNLNLT